VSTCDAPVRGGGTCGLDPGHEGHHATVVFTCDGCGKRYRGQPHRTGPDGEYPDGLHFCFLCSDEQFIEAECFVCGDLATHPNRTCELDHRMLSRGHD
jgi:hypothetical protein